VYLVLVSLAALFSLVYFLALGSDAYEAVTEYAQSSSEISSLVGNLETHILVPCCMRLSTDGLDGRARFLVYLAGNEDSIFVDFELKRVDGHWIVESFD